MCAFRTQQDIQDGFSQSEDSVMPGILLGGGLTK